MAVRPPKRSSDLRSASEDMDTLHRLGFGKGIPHSEGSTRVGKRTLRELRDKVRATGIACDALFRHMAAVDEQLTELLGDDTTPGGAA
jgi:hypothetical protein